MTSESAVRLLRGVVRWEGRLIVASLFAVLVFLAYGSINNPWYRIVVVTGGSMSPTVDPGDVIVVTRPNGQVAPGMVVTLQVDKAMVTHRVIEVKENGGFITQGDANPTPDDWGASRVRLVGIGQLRIRLLGYLFLMPRTLLSQARGVAAAP